MRALDRGWCWGVDPRRRNSPALISPRGTIFEFRGRCLVKFRNVFELEAAA